MSIEILRAEPALARCTYTVRIGGSERMAFRDQQLVNIVDAGGDTTQANVCNNFGGFVTPIPGGLYRVVVFID